MGRRGGGAAEHSAERRETTAHLGSAREPERAAASSSSLFPSRPSSSSVPAWPVSRLYLCSSGSSAPLFLSAAPSNLSDPDKRGGLPPTSARQLAGGPGLASHQSSLSAAPPPAAAARGRLPAAPRPNGLLPAPRPRPRPQRGQQTRPRARPLAGLFPLGWGGAAPHPPCPSRMAWGHCLPALRQLAVKIIIKGKTNTPIRSFLDTRVGATAAQVFLFPGWK